MNRRVFGMTVLGAAAAARSPLAQAPGWSQFKPYPGSLKEKMHSRGQIRSASAPVDATRTQLQEIIKKEGRVDIFSLDAQHRPVPDERDLVKFCKARRRARSRGPGLS